MTAAPCTPAELRELARDIELVIGWPNGVAGLRALAEQLDATKPSEPTNTQKLAAFGWRVITALRSEPGSDLEGGDAQEFAVDAGVLVEREVTAPCGDNCVCAEVGALPDVCYFLDVHDPSPTPPGVPHSVVQAEEVRS